MKLALRPFTLGLCALLIIASPAHGQHFSNWEPPQWLGSVVNSVTADIFASVSKDGLSLYFTSSRTGSGSQGGADIYVCQRQSVSDAWGPPQNLGPTINTGYGETAPYLSNDGHRLYFASTRPDGFGGNDIYVSRRRDKRDDFGWGPPVNLGPNVNTTANESHPSIFEDDETGLKVLYFDSNRLGGLGPFTSDGANNGNDLYSSFLLPDGSFTPAQFITELSTTFADRAPSVRRDGLEIFFTSDRPACDLGVTCPVGLLDLWVATREKTTDPWNAPVNLGPPVNSAGNDGGPALSFDGTTLYFQSVRPPQSLGLYDLWVTTRSKLTGRDRDKD